MKFLKIIISVIGIGILLMGIYNLYLHIKETNTLHDYILEMKINKNNYSSEKEYLYAISEYLNSDFNTNSKTWKKLNLRDRPFLRDSVLNLLTNKEGVCGEGTRVLVRIFQSLGYDATRLSFYNKRFGASHTLISVIINNKEVIIDSINYPESLHSILKKEDSNMSMVDLIYYNKRFTHKNYDINKTNFALYFKKKYSTYAYEAIPFSKLINKLGFNMHIFNYERPNKYISYLVESTYLIKVIVLFVGLILLGGLFKILYKHPGVPEIES